MAVPTNVLQQVQTYQMAELAYLENSYYAIKHFNKQFENFQDEVANLGDSVTFDAPARYVGYTGLVITQQPSNQRVQTLTCSQAYNVSAGYTDQQFIFNVEKYMERFGRAAVQELGALIEGDILLNVISQMTVTDPQNSNVGTVYTDSGPFRFFGDGVNAINSVGQLAQMKANFESYGVAKNDLQCVMPVGYVPAIVNSALNQFVLRRNEEKDQSWELGRWNGIDWYESNLLPVHTAGTIGDAAAPNNILTVVSTNDPTGANVTQITCTEPTAGTDADAIKIGDMFQIQDGTAGLPNVRFLTFIGHKQTNLPVQMVATADAATVAGAVTITIRTINGVGLCWQNGNANQNINTPIQVGMKIKVMPSHQAGLLHSGKQAYLAMPRLPDESPFNTSIMQDAESGASIRHYWGSQFGQNNRSYVRDSIYGATILPDNCMRMLFPL